MAEIDLTGWLVVRSNEWSAKTQVDEVVGVARVGDQSALLVRCAKTRRVEAICDWHFLEFFAPDDRGYANDRVNDLDREDEEDGEEALLPEACEKRA